MVVEIFLLKILTKSQAMIIQINHHLILITLETPGMQKFPNNLVTINIKMTIQILNQLVQIFLEHLKNHKDSQFIKLVNITNFTTIVNRKALKK